MIQYILPIIAYILPSFLIKDIYASYAVRIILTALVLFMYRKRYEIKVRINFLPVLTGILVFLVWIAVPMSLVKKEFLVQGVMLILKLAGFILITPIIEELFTRDFLIRQTIALERKERLDKIKIGKFTILSFIVSVLFFGFSHYMWMAGIISGILFNLLLYKNKSIGDCIIAHSTSNLLLAVYILYTKSWFLW